MEQPTSPFFQRDALPQLPFPIVGLTARQVSGARMSVIFAHLAPGVVLPPLHSHHHEQVTYVLEGLLHLHIGDESRDLGPGDGALIPGGATHGIVHVGPSGCTFIEACSPVRDEYVALLRATTSGA